MYFRRPIREFLQMFTARVSKARSLTAKMGTFEISLEQIEKLQKRVEEIASEPDLEKRLHMARDPLLVDDLLKRITPEEVKILQRFYSQRLHDAFLVNWYEISQQEREALLKLEKGWCHKRMGNVG